LRFTAKPVSFILALTLVATMVNGDHPAVAASNVPNSSHAAVRPATDGYDGVTLYRGLAFGQGPVGALFPELEGLRQLTAKSDDRISAMVDQIAMADPTFFDRFAADIQSGDRVRIRAALQEADSIGAVASSRIAISQNSAYDVVDQSDIIVLVITLVIVFVIAFAFFAPAQGGDVSTLDRDLAADRIARTLGPSARSG
jgi:hypothetical protein